MIKRGTFYVCVTFLLTFFFAQGVMAAGEVELVLEGHVTSVAPTYMSGHDGDFNWIEGFSLTGDLYLNNVKVGTTSGQVTLSNPPLTVTERYDNLMIRYTNTISGIGTYEVTAQGIALASSTSPTVGDITFAWSGSISNGTGGLLDVYGLSTGNGVSNFMVGGGTYKEVIRVRFGY
ncbi:MAG: hypothetical protein P8Z71_06550 [Candidatus Sulfobium sp.]